MSIFILFIFIVLISVYTFSGLRSIFLNTNKWVYVKYIYLFMTLLFLVNFLALYIYFNPKPINSSYISNLLIGYIFSFVVFTLIFSVFLLINDLQKGLLVTYDWISGFVSKDKDKDKDKEIDRGRRKFIGQIGLAVAALPFASMLYGITKGKYNYKVKKIKLGFKNLPKSFDGFKIVHVSDIHSGSFDSMEDVERGIGMINDQNADAIFFTGDLVNNDTREKLPYNDSFKNMKSVQGTYSILGNHDYGDYKKWDTPDAKKDNFNSLLDYQSKMSFDLMRNENRLITKNGESIRIIGVENWGKPPFPQHGDLDKSLTDVDDKEFKILLSHDPSHWDAKVLNNDKNIDLTLSGHTHGMQFGIEIPGIRWSPSKYVYRRWAGHYQNKNKHLYVNRGFGFLGFPGRVGIWPEITVIELESIS